MSVSKVFDVRPRKNRSRYVKFRDTFSSSNVHKKIFISAETKGMTDPSTEARALNMVGSEKWHKIWGCPTANPRQLMDAEKLEMLTTLLVSIPLFGRNSPSFCPDLGCLTHG